MTVGVCDADETARGDVVPPFPVRSSRLKR
jgi:hypothetical protein